MLQINIMYKLAFFCQIHSALGGWGVIRSKGRNFCTRKEGKTCALLNICFSAGFSINSFDYETRSEYG
ncbi:hypothetical protein Desaci_4513 [Desulfosporosinus acidiphilus SJ4]|uniref:Uncharacterized protein n=1 Tax=Desulfosporosinus acidiphilus (strain DSM 22704 / JCM 16185 / SJ4) TaxID=646529 RepID=I4DC30_DESAJ|nr:hypothetical protein Desaci_4513 [Desulfosporosinus acidiphilus SJ4]